jgi:NADH dehydrogenase
VNPGPPRLLIAGGGAGGLELAISLAHQARRYRGMAEILLLDRFATHFWKPRLHEVAAGAVGAAGVDYARLAERHGFRFIQGRMQGLDAASRHVRLEGSTIGYDYLVLALGSVVNDFDTPGVDAFCNMLDDVPQAEQLRLRIRDGMRHDVNLDDSNPDDPSLDDTNLGIAIIGAGATGVELAAEIRAEAGRHPLSRRMLDAGRLRITIIDLADRVLPAGPPDLSRSVARRLRRQGIELALGQRVVEVTEKMVRLADGRMIEASVKVWASGVKAPDWLKQCTALRLARDNRIEVDEALRCRGAEAVFAMGDCAAFTPRGAEKPLPPTAQAAHQQARYLAGALPRLLRGAPLGAFHYRDYGMLVSLGERQVVGQVSTPVHFRLRGAAARLLYAGLYQSHLAALFGWRKTAEMAGARLARRTPGIALKLHNISPSG